MIRVLSGDCRDILPSLDRFDACVTDPPYHLTSTVERFGKAGSAPAQFGNDGAFARASRGFMGKQWDGGDIAFRPETWRLVFAALKPGAHLAAFGAPRSFHRMAVAIEDAGFEIRDCLSWLFGSGFPKSHNLDGEHIGWGTALKPAWEPIILARKPLIGTVAANVCAHGTGAIHIDACRIGNEVRTYSSSAEPGGNAQRKHGGDGRDPEQAVAYGEASRTRPPTTVEGRWPANVLHDGSDEVMAAFAAFGESSSKAAARGGSNPNPMDWGNARSDGHIVKGHTESGTAARFFYSAKAGKDDRNGSKHPTVKPLALMRWLCRLITPPGGHILDPFAGSGTTGEAARCEGFRATLIEQDAQYVADIKRRIGRASGDDTPLFAAMEDD